MKKQVDGFSHIYKDQETGVIVNRESSERSRYQIAKRTARLNHDNQEEISSLRREMDEIKSMLKQLLDR